MCPHALPPEANSYSLTALDILHLEGVTARPPDLSPEQSRRCSGQNVAAIEGPRQEADSTPSNALKGYAALGGNVPHLKTNGNVATTVGLWAA